MPTTMLDTLIDVYALNKVGAVRRDRTLLEGAFGRKLEELEDDIDFPTLQNFVEERRRRIDDTEASWRVTDRQAQIGACLRLVWNAAPPGGGGRGEVERRMDVTARLFLRMFAGKWSAEQVAHVEFVLGMLKDWKAFFLSYTNKSTKPFNDTYADVIRAFVEPTILKSRNWDTDNLVAEAVQNLLRRANLHYGFYDKINVQVSDNLHDKIAPAAGGSFMFVQVVQRDTFSTAPPPPNWCFEEYTVFQRVGERTLSDRQSYREVFRKRFAPLLIDDKQPVQWPFEYEAWLQRAYSEQRYERLPTTAEAFDAAIHRLAKEIVNLQGQIIDCVPA